VLDGTYYGTHLSPIIHTHTHTHTILEYSWHLLWHTRTRHIYRMNVWVLVIYDCRCDDDGRCDKYKNIYLSDTYHILENSLHSLSYTRTGHIYQINVDVSTCSMVPHEKLLGIKSTMRTSTCLSARMYCTKNCLESSGCRTRPLKTSGYQPRRTQMGTHEKCASVWS